MAAAGDAERYARIEALFHAASELPAAERDAWLRAQCGEDEALRARVAAMLAADEEGPALLERGLAAAALGVLVTPEPALPRQTFGPYRVTGVLGEGGMGVVYRAVRDDLKSEAAVKILRDASLSPARRERFAFEQRALAQLNHPAIARLYDADTLGDGTPWFAMELVEGEPITAHAKRNALSVVAKLRLFRDVCEAVKHAHAHAILHRDLKPSNILVRPDGGVKLLDFGIAKPLETLDDPAGKTRTGLRLMTPAYAAPEQVRGEALGVHTDVYSLGVVLYELLAGRLPFDLEGRTPSEAGRILTQQAPKKPSAYVVGEERTHTTRGPGRSAWADLDVLCMTAMHPDPARRYPTVDALERDVERYLEDRPLEARGDSFGYRAGKFVRRHAPAVTAAAAAFVALVSVVGFYTWRLEAARDAAQAEAQRAQRIRQFMTDLFEGHDSEAGPSDTLRVISMLAQGVQDAPKLASEPAAYADLERTLGSIYQQLGHLSTAESLLTSALGHARHLRPADPQDVASDMVTLALIRSDEGHHDAAVTLAREALAFAKQSLKPGDLVIAQATAGLGHALLLHEKYVDAMPVLREAERLYRAPGTPEKDLADVMTLTANVHFYQGDFAASDSISRIVLEMTKQMYGPRHPNVADDLIDLGASQDDEGHYEQAVRDFRDALDITRSWYGPDSPKTADNELMLARGVIWLQRYDEADSLLHRALAILRHAYGPDHTTVAGAYNEIGNIQLSRHQYAAAESSFTESARIYRKLFGDHSSKLGIALANIGSIGLQSGDNHRAEVFFRRALSAYEGAIPTGSFDFGVSRIKLGRALLRQKRYAEGEHETLAGYNVLAAQSDPAMSFIKAARTDLVADYEALGRTADAAKFRAELAAAAAKSH
jgi:serine/threonine-protein kinase